MSDSEQGSITAAPTPCRARAATSVTTSGARPQSAEARREEPDAREVDAPRAEPVAEEAADQQHHGEDQRIAVDDPLQARDAGRRDRCRAAAARR